MLLVLPDCVHEHDVPNLPVVPPDLVLHLVALAHCVVAEEGIVPADHTQKNQTS